jgi:hypothetical protein
MLPLQFCTGNKLLIFWFLRADAMLLSNGIDVPALEPILRF